MPFKMQADTLPVIVLLLTALTVHSAPVLEENLPAEIADDIKIPSVHTIPENYAPVSGVYIPQGSLVIKASGIPRTQDGDFDLNFIKEVLEKHQIEKSKSIKIKIPDRKPLSGLSTQHELPYLSELQGKSDKLPTNALVTPIILLIDSSMSNKDLRFNQQQIVAQNQHQNIQQQQHQHHNHPPHVHRPQHMQQQQQIPQQQQQQLQQHQFQHGTKPKLTTDSFQQSFIFNLKQRNPYLNGEEDFSEQLKMKAQELDSHRFDNNPFLNPSGENLGLDNVVGGTGAPKVSVNFGKNPYLNGEQLERTESIGAVTEALDKHHD